MSSDMRSRLEERAKLINEQQQQEQVIPTEVPVDTQSSQNVQGNNPKILELRKRLASRQTNFQKQKESPYETYVKRPGQIAATSIVGGFRALPRTAFDFMKFIVEKTGGNIKDLEKAQEKSPEWLKKAANRVFPTYESERERATKMGYAVPRNFAEKWIEKGGRFIGESPYFGGIGGVQGALGLTGAALGSQSAEELKLGPWGSAALTIGGALLAHKAGGGPKAFSGQKITPEVEAYMAASKEAGIDPMLTGMNPKMLQKAAQKWATHGIGGPEILENAYKSRSAQVAKQFEKAMEETGSDLFNSTYEAGEGLKESVRNATKQVEMNKSQLYRAVDKTLPKSAVVIVKDPVKMEQSLTKAIESINDTMLITPAQSPAYSKLTDLRNILENYTKHDQTVIPVKRLEGTKRALNEVIKYDRPGGYDKMLIPFSKEIESELSTYAKINPKYRAARKAANEYFANDVVHIRQNLLQSIARAERPESTLAIMNTVSGVKNVERALNALPNGKTLTDSLKRYKLNSIIRDKILDPSTGLMKVGGLKDFLTRKSKDFALIKELAGPKSLGTLKTLETTGKGLERGFNTLVNPSKTADTLIALNSVLSPGKKIASGVKKLLSLNLGEGSFEVVSGLANIIAPKAMAKMILDPKFAEKVFKLSQASKVGNWKAFNKILDSIDNDIKNDQGAVK